MSEWNSRSHDIVDAHVHMWDLEEAEKLETIRLSSGIERMNLVAFQKQTRSNLPQALYMKACCPERYFVFGCLDHTERISKGKVQTPGLSEQVNRGEVKRMSINLTELEGVELTVLKEKSQFYGLARQIAQIGFAFPGHHICLSGGGYRIGVIECEPRQTLMVRTQDLDANLARTGAVELRSSLQVEIQLRAREAK